MRNLLWRADGELRMLCSEHVYLMNDLSATLTITPSNALTQRDAEVAARALEDAADWHGEADWPTYLIEKAAEIRSGI